MTTDKHFQEVVELELARMVPCELMKLQPQTKKVNSGGTEVEITYHILDLGDTRHIGVLASRDLLVGYQKYSAGITVQSHD